MPAEEIDRFLRTHRWGILSTVADQRPYAVPVGYGYDGESIFLASGPGRKADNLESCSAICLTVSEVVDGDQWGCVVVMGDALRIDDLRGRIAALAALGRRLSPGAIRRDLARLAQTRLYRVVPTEITGRTRGVGG